ncbi:hypothetical protein [Hymenobacter actinosclerus]|uniref:Uncharacterized protein n=1 Tax=Hymenobacter actinosclerus TaxID=82805 RepID=A0A1I0DJ59_9BACT|nr:hypothetical protein [Hymenobacter actinosclerus]SET32479.1 hypothetical protein SAMN04487998_1428 [Hymenobacter actinosclerus]
MNSPPPDIPALLARILASRQPADVFTLPDYRPQYLLFLKLLHPDVCALPGAHDAVSRLNHYVELLTARLSFTDDAGPVRVLPDHRLRFEGEAATLRQSATNYARLMALHDPAAQHFKQYLPSGLVADGAALLATPPVRVVPLAGLTLPVEHVAWVLSRLLELTAWLHQAGFCHGGWQPESLALAPKTHGLVALSFYHLAPLNGRLRTVSGRYRHWYPDALFVEKRATPAIDLLLAQRTALALLGDASGHGVRLRGRVDERLLTFLLRPQHNAYAMLVAYRQLLRQLFPVPQFHPLNL